MPSWASWWRCSQNSRRAPGSTPAVGSSRSSSFGSCSRQAASARRCFHPPESVPASWPRRLPEPEALERLVDPAAAVGQPVDSPDELEVLRDRQVLVEAEALRHVADLALDPRRLAQDVEAEARAAAAVGGEQAAEHADRRGLAAAVGPQEAVDLAPAHLEREAVDDHLAVEALGETFDVDGEGGFGHGGATYGSTTSRGWPGFRRVASAAAGRASTRKTSFARLSLL